MNIVFEDAVTPEVKEKYTLLALDKFYSKELDTVRTAYCLIENIPLAEMPTLENYINLHESLMNNFYKRDWNFCEQAIEHLTGKWNGVVDSFYDTIAKRIESLKNSNLDDTWTGII